jgi:astacin
MHYGAFAFSKNGQPTIEVLQSGAIIGQRTALSAGDIAAIHAMYETWHYNKRVYQTFASSDAQNAWANIESLGWRKIKTGAADGVTNMLAAFCEAVANNIRVHAYADGQNVSIMYLA